jgi:hypothetical protein
MPTPRACCYSARASNSTRPWRAGGAHDHRGAPSLTLRASRSDYLRDLLWVAFIQRFGLNATDVIKVCHVYKHCPHRGNWGG